MDYKEEIEKLNSDMEKVGQRAAEIQGELENADEETTLKLKAELEELDKRSKEIPAQISDLDKKREEEAAQLFKETKEREAKEKLERKSNMNKEELEQFRSEQVAKLRRGETVKMNYRDVLISSAGITNPAKTEKEVRPGFYSAYSLIDLVDAIQAKGSTSCVLPIEGADPTAANGTDGQVANNSDPVFLKATLTAQPINVVTYVSKHINSYTETEYYAKIQEKVGRAVRKKVLDYILAKAVAGQADNNTALYDDVSATVTALDADFLRKMVLNYGADGIVDGGAVLCLCKEDLATLGAVRGTNEKQALYSIQFEEGSTDTGIISEGGVAVRFYICESLKGAANNTLILMKPQAFSLAVFEDIQVSVSRDEKFSYGLLSVLAECSIGGNLNALHGAEWTAI